MRLHWVRGPQYRMVVTWSLIPSQEAQLPSNQLIGVSVKGKCWVVPMNFMHGDILWWLRVVLVGRMVVEHRLLGIPSACSNSRQSWNIDANFVFSWLRWATTVSEVDHTIAYWDCVLFDNFKNYFISILLYYYRSHVFSIEICRFLDTLISEILMELLGLVCKILKFWVLVLVLLVLKF